MPIESARDKPDEGAAKPATGLTADRVYREDAATRTGITKPSDAARPAVGSDGFAIDGDDKNAQMLRNQKTIKTWDAASNNIILRNKDDVDRPQNNLYRVLEDRLKATGLDKDWAILPSQTGSALDQVGGDFILANRKTGEVHFMDATQNQEKLNNPEKNNVPRMRIDGLVGFDNKLIDKMGHLKVDSDDPTERHNAQELQDQIDLQLRHLSEKGSPITVDMLPILTKDSAEKTAKSTEMFAARLEKIAQTYPPGQERADLEDFSRGIKQGANKYNDAQSRTAISPELNNRVSKTADKVVLDYALAKLGLGNYPASDASITKAPANDTGTRILKDGKIVFQADGAIYDGGSALDALKNSRVELRANREHLQELIENNSRLMKTMNSKGISMNKMVSDIQRTLMGSPEIDNGGRLGEQNFKLQDAVATRVSRGNLEALVAPAKPDASFVVAKPDVPAKAENVKPEAFDNDEREAIRNIETVTGKLAGDPKKFNNDVVMAIELLQESDKSPALESIKNRYIAEKNSPSDFISRVNGALGSENPERPISIDLLAKADLKGVVSDFGKQSVNDAAKLMFFDAVSDSAAMGRFLDQFSDQKQRDDAQKLVEKVKGFSDSDRATFFQKLQADQATGIELPTRPVAEGHIGRSAGGVTSILVLASVLIATIQSAQASEGKKTKVPFFVQ